MFWDSLAYCHSTSASNSDRLGWPSYGFVSNTELVDKEVAMTQIEKEDAVTSAELGLSREDDAERYGQAAGGGRRDATRLWASTRSLYYSHGLMRVAYIASLNFGTRPSNVSAPIHGNYLPSALQVTTGLSGNLATTSRPWRRPRLWHELSPDVTLVTHEKRRGSLHGLEHCLSMHTWESYQWFH